LPPKRATAERTESRDLKQTIAGARWVVLAVAALTALGLALRLARYQQSVEDGDAKRDNPAHRVET